MKRVGYLYEKLLNKDLINLAIIKAAQGKHYKKSVRAVLEDKDKYIDLIYDMFKTDSVELSVNRKIERYDYSCCKVRVITVPKFFPDQIIHWCVMLVLQPVIMKGMYQYCCGSVPNRGGAMAKNYLEKALKNKRIKYVVKTDIKKFFPSIRVDILIRMLNRKIKDKRFLALIEKILYNGAPNGVGLPIGFYTSQWLSNFFLEGFDHYIKETLGVEYFVRYADDGVLLGTNKRKLHRVLTAVIDYLNGIALTIKGNYQLWKVGSRPIDFVGYKYVGYTLLRNKIYLRLCRRMRTIRKKGRATVRQARGVLSLIGWVKRIQCYKLKEVQGITSCKVMWFKRVVSEYDKRAA